MSTMGERPTIGAGILPVTGAWQPGDPVGDRRFFTLPTVHFSLEGGGKLREVTLAYETWGELNADGSNAILVCHALTADSHVAARSGRGSESPGWWGDLVGPGGAIDTDRFYVVCANILGGCQGTTGPASVDPVMQKRYGSTFPIVSIRDMVRSQAGLADHLGVRRWLSVVGGSMGGQQVLEWAVMFPDRVASIVPIATNAAATAQQIAFGTVQRFAIALDPKWRGGDYYEAKPGDGPHLGLALARQIAHITYRTDQVFEERFGLGSVDPLDAFTLWQRFDVESYLDYQGTKLVKRFDANSYLRISKAMDLHDIGRRRPGGVEGVLGRITVPVLTMSVSTDVLFPPDQQERIRDGVRAGGGRCDHAVITSPDGHDGFLLATDQISASLAPFLDEMDKTYD